MHTWQLAQNRSMRALFSKGLLLQIRMQQQHTECILVSWIEILRLFDVWTDFTNVAAMLSDLLRNLTLNRRLSAHCTQVSYQCPLGLLFALLYRNLNFGILGDCLTEMIHNIYGNEPWHYTTLNIHIILMECIREFKFGIWYIIIVLIHSFTQWRHMTLTIIFKVIDIS